MASIVVTGSSGFIGSHLCTRLAQMGCNGAVRALDLLPPPVDAVCPGELADITVPDQIRAVDGKPADTVFHLAARAEVVVPYDEVPNLNATNVSGTVNVLRTLAPKRVIFASTSAVYGNGPRPRVDTRWSNVNPVGTYGMTKATAELACSDWARRTGGSAISFRLGNVVGPRCRGLIPYLVRHAKNHPDGAVAAPMRGNGQVIRDYVPVGYVVDIFQRASELNWGSGASLAFNIGTGRGMSNGEVAALVSDVLRTAGYVLRPDPSAPLEFGEADHVVLDMSETVSAFDMPVPTAEAVRDAISDAVLWWLEAA